jgi:hypothetical protein
MLDPKYERCVSSQFYNRVAEIEHNLPRATCSQTEFSPDSEKFVIHDSDVKKIAMPGLTDFDESVVNFNIEDEELPTETNLNPDI